MVACCPIAVHGLIAALVALGLSAPAAKPPPKKRRAISKKRRARRLAKKSERAYRDGRLGASADLLRRAYKLEPAPILLFNLARVLDDAGELEEAKQTYERYLKSTKRPRDRARIEARLKTLEQMLAERAAARAPPPPPPPPVSAPPPEVAPPPPAPPTVVVKAPVKQRSAPVGPWLVMSAGAGAGIAGAVFAVLAEQKRSSAEAEPIQIEAARQADTARTFGTVRTASFIAGGALVVGGLLWLLLGRDASEVAVSSYSDLGLATRLRF